MNMISTGAFLTEMDASQKQETLVAKLVSAWEKKNAKVARAGGLSLMALSLAACGSDDDTATTTSTSTTTTTTTTTAVTPITSALTIGQDSITGTTANDSITGARIDTVQTWNSTDTLAGGDGTDSFSATIAAAVTPAAGGVTGIENLTLTNVAGASTTVTFSTATVTGIDDVTSITNLGSTASSDLVLTRVVDLAEVTLENTVAATTITFADTVLAGTADTFTLNVNGNTGAINIGNSSGAGTGIETLVINSNGATSTFSAVNLDATPATVTIKGSAALDLNAAAAFPKMATLNAGDFTGDLDILLGADTVTGTADAKTLTFGSGNDDLDLGALDPGQIGVLTVNMGAGNDATDLDNYADTTMVIDGGDGTDSLTTATAITAANGTLISNYETFIFGQNAGTQDLSLLATNSSFTSVNAAAATTTMNNAGANVATLNLVGGVATTAATFDRLIDNTTNALTVKATTANMTLTGDLTIDDEETVTFDSSSFDLVVQGDIATADATSIVLTGDNIITLGANGSKEFSSVKITSIDASGVTGSEAVSVFAINNTSAMTVTGPASTGTFIFDGGTKADTITAGGGIMDVDAGAGDDIITGGAKADILEGDGGADTITGGAAADYIAGGAGRDVIDLTETTAAVDEVELSSGATTVDKITGFLAGGVTGADNISALQATHGFNSTDGTSTVLLSTGATLKAADNAADSNIATISTNVAAGTFDSFLAGTMTEASMEANVITALGLTGALDAAAVVLVFVDDGEDTGVIKFTGNDAGTDDLAATTEIEIMAVLDGIADATDIVVGDVLMT